MRMDLSFWRFVIIISISKSFLWGKAEDTYLLHVGTFSDGKQTAFKFVLLPLCIMAGFAK